MDCDLCRNKGFVLDEASRRYRACHCWAQRLGKPLAELRQEGWYTSDLP